MSKVLTAIKLQHNIEIHGTTDDDIDVIVHGIVDFNKSRLPFTQSPTSHTIQGGNNTVCITSSQKHQNYNKMALPAEHSKQRAHLYAETIMVCAVKFTLGRGKYDNKRAGRAIA
ncbi:MAG: hypothetical protein FWE21_02980 [Defluviitaleaceae bacterium]|nr:hypothetical protein [Defluviitaleaceae bacterium]